MHHVKNRHSWKQGNPLSNTIKDTSTIMQGGLRMIVLYSILDSIAKGISLFPRFFAWCIPYSFIFTLVPHIFRGSRINAAIIHAVRVTQLRAYA